MSGRVVNRGVLPVTVDEAFDALRFAATALRQERRPAAAGLIEVSTDILRDRVEYLEKRHKSFTEGLLLIAEAHRDLVAILREHNGSEEIAASLEKLAQRCENAAKL